jgi:hypothetical protein
VNSVASFSCRERITLAAIWDSHVCDGTLGSKTMTFEFRRIVSYPANVIAIAIVFSGIYIVTEGIISPRVKDGVSVLFTVLRLIEVCYLLSIFVVIIGTVMSLIRRKWYSAVCYFAATCIAYVATTGTAALQGDRFVFPDWSHRETADIYSQRGLGAAASQEMQLIALDEQCHPPRDCECWILLDAAHTSWRQRWHRPRASIFVDSGFAIVHVRRLNADAYSVLSCAIDWTSLKPV